MAGAGATGSDALARLGGYAGAQPQTGAVPRSEAERGMSGGGSGIVYCSTRREVDRLTAFLRDNGVDVLPYHAGLTAEERQANQEQFNLERAAVMVATVAFGMGIDKQNVRFVVHVNLPKDMESYYQETGRAGRDGDPGHCLLLYSTADIPIIRSFFNDLPEDTLKRAAAARLQVMVRYGSGLACRRRQILRYFGEEYPRDTCGACDVCLGAREAVDITEDGQKALSAIYRTGQRFGAAHIIDILTGADTEKVRRYRHDAIKTFGAGREKGKPYWRAVLDELIGQECLHQDGERYATLSITPAGGELLYGRRRLAASRDILVRKAPPAPLLPPDGPVDGALLEKLKTLRRELAALRQVPPYLIASDRTLREVCILLPANEEELRRVHGIGEKKLQDLGPSLLEAVRRHREEVRRDEPFPPG
jgi:ATP-dependent DNA helicase RecQ